MSDAQWMALYVYILPVLAGLTLLMVICRVLMLWQKERTRRAVWFLLVYFSLFALFLGRSLKLNLATITTGYVLLSIALVVCNWYEWHDFIVFLRKKNAALVGDVVGAGSGKLGDLSDKDTPVALEATPKEPDVKQ